MGSLERRLERLMHPEHLAYEDWPLENQVEDALCCAKPHMRWGSVAACTDRELYCLGLLIASEEHPEMQLEELSPVGLDDFPEKVRKHGSRLDPGLQPERDAWLRKEAGYFVRELEELPARIASIEEQQRAQMEESRRRDREFLERQRARRSQPPLDTTILD